MPSDRDMFAEARKLLEQARRLPLRDGMFETAQTAVRSLAEELIDSLIVAHARIAELESMQASLVRAANMTEEQYEARLQCIAALAERWENATDLGTGNPSIVARAFAAELRKALEGNDAQS